MKKRVFLSFRVEDKKQVDGIRLMAANDNFDLEFYDESVRVPYDSDDARYIRARIKEKIDRTSVCVCFVNDQTHTSKWVDWEIETSAAKLNRVICMGLPGVTGNLTLPPTARMLKLPWHLWDHNKLKQLIDAP
jgi:hypothetical protein